MNPCEMDCVFINCCSSKNNNCLWLLDPASRLFLRPGEGYVNSFLACAVLEGGRQLVKDLCDWKNGEGGRTFLEFAPGELNDASGFARDKSNARLQPAHDEIAEFLFTIQFPDS